MKKDNVDAAALALLRKNRHQLTKQQYKTLRGQILAGDPRGAAKGLRKIILQQSESPRDLLRRVFVDEMREKERADAVIDTLKPCVKYRAFCRVQIVITASGLYRVGCEMHGVWQNKAYKTIEEAAEAWNRERTTE